MFAETQWWIANVGIAAVILVALIGIFVSMW